MTIEERVKLAEEKHHSGYNCAQAVLCSYSDKLGIDEETFIPSVGRIWRRDGRYAGNLWCSNRNVYDCRSTGKLGSN